MSQLPIITYPNLLLKKRSQEIENATSELRTFVKDMFDTMYAASGVGLAAVQVAKPERLLVVDVGKMQNKDDETHEPHPICLVNPEIISMEGNVLFEEGCLSCPDLHIEVERAERIKLRALDEYGKLIELDANGLLAIALQHEMDHLNGVILVDRLSRLKRDSYRKELTKKA